MKTHQHYLFVALFLSGLVLRPSCDFFNPPPPPPTPPQVRYDFETGKMGWVPQDKPGSHAIRRVFQERDSSYTGNSSLGANVKLVGGDTNLDKGEVYVYMLETPPEGITAPVNFENLRIEVWVNIPESVVKEGKVGGIQLFLKDTQFRNLYGSYVDIGPGAKIGLWFPLTLVPREGIRPLKGYIDPDFNTREVVVIGLKIDACGLKDCIMEGDIYIDNISW